MCYGTREALGWGAACGPLLIIMRFLLEIYFQPRGRNSWHTRRPPRRKKILWGRARQASHEARGVLGILRVTIIGTQADHARWGSGSISLGCRERPTSSIGASRLRQDGRSCVTYTYMYVCMVIHVCMGLAHNAYSYSSNKVPCKPPETGEGAGPAGWL